MALKDTLRRRRLQGREKKPFSPSVFSRLGGLVRLYRLGGSFRLLVRPLTAEQAEILARRHRAEAKPRYEPPLFFLAAPEEYRLIQDILQALDNPYLAWAHSPEEILLSHPLWRRRPDLPPETLAGRHFAELFFLSQEYQGGG